MHSYQYNTPNNETTSISLYHQKLRYIHVHYMKLTRIDSFISGTHYFEDNLPKSSFEL